MMHCVRRRFPYDAAGVVAADTGAIAGSPCAISIDSLSISANIGAHDSEVIARFTAACASSIVFHQTTSIQRSPSTS